MFKCKNLRVRKKNYKAYFYCLEFRRIISLLECKNCLKRNLVRNKGIRKVSNKKIIVTADTYKKVIERDQYKCKLCGTSQNLHLHHIIYRSEDRNLINEPSNCTMLCIKCHELVHSNKKEWQPKLKELINK